ncbi:hypothetical protein [Ectobacillus funiculus]|jgi:hypothetical protein|uniref:hypothetical protein n=1 Tax=Ectobacillus funiculus TaxID=137993 RepID=UPI00196A254B|nr:hypothetical protein [Ectobacillus funiculus]
MSEIVLNSQHIFRKEAGRTSLKQNEYLNLPDLQFFNWCNQQYRLNRGIYNTIDEWFYHYGIKEILSRRIYILAFLGFVQETEQESDQHKFIRFGNRGLTKQLTEFIAIQDKESKQNKKSSAMRSHFIRNTSKLPE